MRLRVTPKRSAVAMAVATLVAAILVLVSVRIHASAPLTGDELAKDPRTTGIQSNGRVHSVFHLRDSRFSPDQATVELTLQAGTDTAEEIEFAWGNASFASIRADGPIVIPYLSSSLPEAPQEIHLRVRSKDIALPLVIEQVRLTPHSVLSLDAYVLILVTLGVSALLFLSASASFDPTTKSISLTEPLLLGLLSFLLLTENPALAPLALQRLFLIALLLLAGRHARALLIRRSRTAPEPQESVLRQRDWVIALVVIVALGASLRFFGLYFGLPQLYHPGEARVLSAAWQLHAQGISEIFLGTDSFLLTNIATAMAGVSAFAHSHSVQTELAYYLRPIICVADLLSIVLIFFIGKMLYEERAGLLAASVYAVAPLAVVQSRYIDPLPVLIFFLLLALWSLATALRRHNRFMLFLLTVAIAGAMATSKIGYTFLALWLIPFFLAQAAWYLPRFIRNDSAFLRYLLSWSPMEVVHIGRFFLPCLGFLILFFLICVPQAVLHAPAFYRESILYFETISSNLLSARALVRSLLAAFESPVFWSALTLPVMISTLIGCGWLIARRTARDVLLLASILISLFFLAMYPSYSFADAHFLLVVPGFALAFGAAGSALYRWFLCLPSKRWVARAGSDTHTLEAQPSTWKERYVVIIVALILTQALAFNLRLSASFSSDTRVQAGEWVRKNIAPNSHLQLDSRFSYPMISNMDYRLSFPSRSRPLPSLSQLLRGKADYVSLSSFGEARYRDTPRGRLYEQLRSGKPIAASFERPALEYGVHNPRIDLYDMRALRAENERAY